jgi:hypothetical protein
MPPRGMSSHTAARYCRVICGWGSAASSAIHACERPNKTCTLRLFYATDCIRLGKRLILPQHAHPSRKFYQGVYRLGGLPHATRVRHRRRPLHIAVSYLALELRGAAHARLPVAAPSLTISPSLRARCRGRAFVGRVGRSAAARGRRALRESDPSLPAQAPESPYFPRFEAEIGETRMRENGPRRMVSACDTPTNSLMLLRAAGPRGVQD